VIIPFAFNLSLRFEGLVPEFDTHANLVGGLEHFLFFHILGMIIPTDFHIFQRGRAQPPTSNATNCRQSPWSSCPVIDIFSKMSLH
jgi:hypothetical protein